LLEAGQSLASFKTARLVEHDVVSAPTTDILPARAAAGHDLVVLFGLLHHVPQAERRRALITACAERLRTGGLLAVSFWQYAGRERFDRKIVPWQWAAEHYGIDPADLEAGDTLLSWGRGSQGVRYCHFISRQEAAALLSLDDLVNIDSFDADGETGDLNHYVLMRRLGGRGARPGT
jgi:SAM-dependent methyltransferase